MTNKELKDRCRPIVNALLNKGFSQEEVEHIVTTLIDTGIEAVKDAMKRTFEEVEKCKR